MKRICLLLIVMPFLLGTPNAENEKPLELDLSNPLEIGDSPPLSSPLEKGDSPLFCPLFFVRDEDAAGF